MLQTFYVCPKKQAFFNKNHNLRRKNGYFSNFIQMLSQKMLKRQINIKFEV